MTSRSFGDVTTRRPAALLFVLLLSVQPVVLCCSARAATALDTGQPSTRHHESTAHDGATRRDAAAAHDAAGAPTLGAACTVYVAAAPAMRERSPDVTAIGLLASQSSFPVPSKPAVGVGPRATPALEPTAGHRATPLRI